MATKARKRLSTKENKLLKLDNLELKDVICSICQSILVEPVTLPCYHYFCQTCFNGSVENNALCCPLCRLRIGSWLRTATKQNNLVNIELWRCMQKKFPAEIDTKLKGGDVYLEVSEKPTPRLSAPGEIRSEYEKELQRLREEHIRLEHKRLQETELLIKKIQLEEAEAQKKYVEMLKQDEMLAKQIQNKQLPKIKPKSPQCRNKRKRSPQRDYFVQSRLRPMKIDAFLAKPQAPVAISSSPILTDDDTSTGDSSPPSARFNSRASPELVPNYRKSIKNEAAANNREPPHKNNEPHATSQIHNTELNELIIAKQKETDRLLAKIVTNWKQKQTIFKHNETCKSNDTNCKDKLAKSKQKETLKSNETNCKDKLTNLKQKEILNSNETVCKDKLANSKQKESNCKVKEPTCKEKLTHGKEKEIQKVIQSPKKSLPVSLPLPHSRVPQNKHLNSADTKKLIPLGVIQRRSILETGKWMFWNHPKIGPNKETEEKKRTGSPNTVVETSTVLPDTDKAKREPSTDQQKGDSLVRPMETDSVDSMLQELCYFKPIEKSAPRVNISGQCAPWVPVRVPCERAGGEPCNGPSAPQPPPSRAQYVDGLCRLRHLSLANNLPSAFVIALDILKVKKDAVGKNKRGKRIAAPEDAVPPIQRNVPNKNQMATNCRRRTRSMGSIAKHETPKKPNVERESISERKPYLRSDSKIVPSRKKTYNGPSKFINHKLQSVSRDLSDSLNNCDMKTLLQQIKIQKMIEQEQQDMELARKLDAEMNGRRNPRRLQPVKRQVTINYALRPAKKLKI